MATRVRSFAKINLGLIIGPRRRDGFHNLRTVYQTIALHDVVKVDVGKGVGIEIRSTNPKVPEDETNTCHRVADRVLKLLKTRTKVKITLEKKLPLEGGLGAGSSNGVATLLALEKELKVELPMEERLRIAEEVGSDLPLFLLGGTVLGIGRGEQVFPLQDAGTMHCVVAMPKVGVSTPQAFGDWDRLMEERSGRDPDVRERHRDLLNDPIALTQEAEFDRMSAFSRTVTSWLGGTLLSGVFPARGDRAEAPLLDLVRAGIENDFEQVVFPQFPVLRDIKRELYGQMGDGARYASLSGSGSALYGLFDTEESARAAVERLEGKGVPASLTATLPREAYWGQFFA